jgi:hypothetical protein
MALQTYRNIRFTDEKLTMIDTINEIIADFMGQGFTLTVRQLYYQLVAKDLIPNDERSYKRITNLVNDAREAGCIDWDAIEDRTRNFVRRQRWESGQSILKAAVNSFHMDMWEGQDCRPFVIIEKEALVGVLTGVCGRYDVPVLAARGYPSSSVLREFAVEDIIPHGDAGQNIVILHLGDHDPSGIDMTRDLRERLEMFSEANNYGFTIEVDRIALNMKQIHERKPPPNPAKVTDARFADYQRRFGDESWELDALPPQYLVDLVENHIQRYQDADTWNKRLAHVERVREKLSKLAKGFAA